MTSGRAAQRLTIIPGASPRAQAALARAESLISLRLLTSARDEYATPPPKRYTGLLGGFTLTSDD